MLKILEEDPMVGGVGGDVQVKYTLQKEKAKIKVCKAKTYNRQQNCGC